MTASQRGRSRRSGDFLSVFSLIPLFSSLTFRSSECHPMISLHHRYVAGLGAQLQVPPIWNINVMSMSGEEMGEISK